MSAGIAGRREVMKSLKTAVVIPSYKVADTIADVVLSVRHRVDHIIVIDDACPLSSGKKAEGTNTDNLTVIYHKENSGVGGAVISGYKKAIELGSDVIIKMDGDGQMDPEYLEELVGPIAEGRADYTKGNRFRNFGALRSMPKLRLFGNSILSFLVKAASGYWNIMDPTNGYTAIHRRAIEKLDLEKVSRRFFFESDMLINLNIIDAVVKDIPMPARYGAEKSTLKISKVLFQFPPLLIRGLVRRIFYKYFVYDFNMASVYIIVGLPMFIFGVVLGFVEWLDSIMTGMPRSPGTIMLVALPIIVSFQMLLQAISIDINSVPKK